MCFWPLLITAQGCCRLLSFQFWQKASQSSLHSEQLGREEKYRKMPQANAERRSKCSWRGWRTAWDVRCKSWVKERARTSCSWLGWLARYLVATFLSYPVVCELQPRFRNLCLKILNCKLQDCVGERWQYMLVCWYLFGQQLRVVNLSQWNRSAVRMDTGDMLDSWHAAPVWKYSEDTASLERCTCHIALRVLNLL